MSFNQAPSSGMRFASRTNPQMLSGRDQTLLYDFRGSTACLQKTRIASEERQKMTDLTNPGDTEFAAFVGIDWADQKHAWALRSSSTPTIVERGEVNHTPEAVDAWASELAQRFAGRPIAVGLEQSRGSLLFMLSKYGHLVLFPIHPGTLVNYRKGFRP